MSLTLLTVSTPWTEKMARLLDTTVSTATAAAHEDKSPTAPALVMRATDYWPRIFVHAVWRELHGHTSAGRRLLRITHAGVDLVCMYDLPGARRNLSPELQLEQLARELGVVRLWMPPYACTSFVTGHIVHEYFSAKAAGVPVTPLTARLPRPAGAHKALTVDVDPQCTYMALFRLDPPVPRRPSATESIAQSTGDAPSSLRPRPHSAKQRPPPHVRRTLFPHRASITPAPPVLVDSPSGDVFTDARRRATQTPDSEAGSSGQSDDAPDRETVVGREPGPGPGLSPASSGSSISTLATPASPSPAPRRLGATLAVNESARCRLWGVGVGEDSLGKARSGRGGPGRARVRPAVPRWRL
ncbi:hypothetical protein BC834DRAFT_840253 [Gloeopeniophorella convolvens]|nr:hypothetical protein BC834DRAFT_840253 [Gloeopeniophorella convolvens]